VRKSYGEFVIESLVKASGTVSTIVVLLIVYYLFSEGVGLFSKPEIEDGYRVVASEEVPVDKINTDDLRQIYISGDISNWQQLGGPDLPITAITINNYEEIIPAPLLAGDSIGTEQKIARFMLRTPGTVSILPNSYAAVAEREGALRVELQRLGLGDYLFGRRWIPTSYPVPKFGIWPLLSASLLITVVSIAIAIPIGLVVAIYMTQVATPKVRGVLKPLIELLAGVPSVVYGFFGLVILVPAIQEWFELSSGATALAGAIMLGIISLPTIITLSDDAFRSIPPEMKESSLALGASDLQTTFRVLIPYALSGISSAAILGIGRSIGETMTVLMVTGNSSQMPGSLLDSVRTITATIALELGEAPKGGNHYEALFVLGCVVFLLTLIINLIAGYIATKRQVV